LENSVINKIAYLISINNYRICNNYYLSYFIENFHHLYDLLSQLKISVLDHERKEAKQKYQDALRAYVTQYFGRPLEKLNVNCHLKIFL